MKASWASLSGYGVADNHAALVDAQRGVVRRNAVCVEVSQRDDVPAGKHDGGHARAWQTGQRGGAHRNAAAVGRQGGGREDVVGRQGAVHEVVDRPSRTAVGPGDGLLALVAVQQRVGPARHDARIGDAVGLAGSAAAQVEGSGAIPHAPPVCVQTTAWDASTPTTCWELLSP